MAEMIGSILRQVTRRDDEPLNVLTFPTHERYETGLCKTGHRFWAFRSEGIKDWNKNYAPVPENYVLLNPALKGNQLPTHVDFDLVLSQNKFGQFQIASQIARKYHLPLVCIEHTLPVPGWPKQQVDALKAMKGDINLFISEFSREQWGWAKDEALVVHHGVDTENFSPNDMLVEKKNHALSVVNDWKNRDWCCGFNFWRESTQGLPVFVVGDTPGLSEPAKSVAELVMRYREARVFVNTSLISPVPTALLEAMACGCAVVSTSNCMIPEIIQSGVNGFLADNPKQLRGYIEILLSDENLAQSMGEEARRTILERFSMDRFVSNWNAVFGAAALLTFTGE